MATREGRLPRQRKLRALSTRSLLPEPFASSLSVATSRSGTVGITFWTAFRVWAVASEWAAACRS